MDRTPRYNRQIAEPAVLIPPGYITIAEAVSIVSEEIPETEPRISGCTPAEHYLRSLLSQQIVEALIQHHTDGQCEPMPYQAWSEPTAPMVFEDGMLLVGGIYSHRWASVRINELQLRNTVSSLNSCEAPSEQTVQPRKLGRRPSYDWVAVEQYVYSVLEEHGMPSPDDPAFRNQAALEKKILEFCQKRFGREPAAGGLRPKLAKWLREFEGQKSRG